LAILTYIILLQSYINQIFARWRATTREYIIILLRYYSRDYMRRRRALFPLGRRAYTPCCGGIDNMCTLYIIYYIYIDWWIVSGSPPHQSITREFPDSRVGRPGVRPSVRPHATVDLRGSLRSVYVTILKSFFWTRECSGCIVYGDGTIIIICTCVDNDAQWGKQ